MATVTVELTRTDLQTPPDATELRSNSSTSQDDADQVAPASAVTVAPDGGYGWVVVFCCSVLTFWFSGLTGSWGIIQAALLSDELKGVPSSTMAFIGSLSITICVAFGLLAVRFMQTVGIRAAAVIGIALLGIGALTSGFTTENLAGLFQTYGVVLGIGDCLCYTTANVMAGQYFTRRLGLANALIKLGGGLGATILSLTVNSLINRVGVDWTFRILGFMILATGLPAAFAIKERVPQRKAKILDLALFKDLPYTAVFIAGATATFTLFVAPFFLPLFAESIGLSRNTAAGLVAGFNICTTAGRFVAGPLIDSIGPFNTCAIFLILNAVTMLGVWPVSSTLPPLIIFIALNGLANGAFFTTLPLVASSMVDPSRASVAMSMSITGWTGGYLMGPPIAGYLLEAHKNGVAIYRNAIWYAGGLATFSSLCVLAARFFKVRKVLKKV